MLATIYIPKGFTISNIVLNDLLSFYNIGSTGIYTQVFLKTNTKYTPYDQFDSYQGIPT